MASARRKDEVTSRSGRPRATTPEARERQMVNLAFDLAEKQMREGTASATVIAHYLKLGSSREFLEQEKLQHENEMLQARREQIESQKRVEELYSEALQAMRSYAGQEPRGDDLDD